MTQYKMNFCSLISGLLLLSSLYSYYVCVFGGALLESCTGGLVYR